MILIYKGHTYTERKREGGREIVSDIVLQLDFFLFFQKKFSNWAMFAEIPFNSLKLHII